MIRKYSDSIEKTPFFFIIARPRSGTTLLQTIFKAHPNVIMPHESAVILECYKQFKQVENWDNSKILELVDFLYQVRKFEGWKIRKENLIETLLDYSGTYSFETIIKIIYSHYDSFFKKEEIHIFGDKNPKYSKYPNELKKIFPNAMFVHIVRDYRDHILSMKKVKLLNSNLAVISDFWRKSQKKIFAFTEKYPDSIISFKYEDFVTEPEHCLKKICGFLNIDYVPSILHYSDKEEELKKTNENIRNMKDVFHENLFKPITADNVEKWKYEMTKAEIAKADFYVGKYAELSGYKRQVPRRTVSGLLSAFPGYLYLYSFYFTKNIIGLLPTKWRESTKRKILIKRPDQY